MRCRDASMASGSASAAVMTFPRLSAVPGARARRVSAHSWSKCLVAIYVASAVCIVLGYVSTSYARRAEGDAQMDINKWRSLYPRTQGIFFDEMVSAPRDATAAKVKIVAVNFIAIGRILLNNFSLVPVTP